MGAGLLLGYKKHQAWTWLILQEAVGTSQSLRFDGEALVPILEHVVQEMIHRIYVDGKRVTLSHRTRAYQKRQTLVKDMANLRVAQVNPFQPPFVLIIFLGAWENGDVMSRRSDGDHPRCVTSESRHVLH